jgi:hypothetical protein
MFLGHYALGFAAKRWAPKTSLAVLVGAALWLDIVWPAFVLFGWEHFRVDPGASTKMLAFDFTDYPLSHSLVMALAWGALLGLGVLAWKKNAQLAWIIAGLVVSHWVLDFLVHRPDLPLTTSPLLAKKYGLGIWSSYWGTLILEGAFFAFGLKLYLMSTKAKDRIGSIAFWGFVAFLLLIYAGAVTRMPPDKTDVIAFSAQISGFLLLAWAYWFDGHRKASGV